MPENENEKLYTGSLIEAPKVLVPAAAAYAELDVTTNFSFLRGGSHPDELVKTAAILGYRALAITDINSVAGTIRAYEEARKIEGFQLIIGVRLVFNDGSPDMLVWPMTRSGYSRLCSLLTVGRLRAPKGECWIGIDDFLEHSEGQQAAFCLPTANADLIRRVQEWMGDRLSLALRLSYGPDDEATLAAAQTLSHQTRVPLVATNGVCYHDAGRRALQNVLTCVREKCRIDDAGGRLDSNAERYLKEPERMHRLFESCPGAIRRALHIAAQCTFSISELSYEYPIEAIPPGADPSRHLRELTYVGAAERYPKELHPDGIPQGVIDLLEKELTFICGSKYESYFLTVHDLVREANARGILCQGRGSAANSAVCYCLGVTSVDPNKFQLVFERFSSAARSEPPDIDIDFEHERREEIIQYVYEKYGRDRAGMTASLITYRGRSAVRDVGKALGFSQDSLDQLAGKLDWWHKGTLSPEQLREAGVDPADKTVMHLISLTTQLLGFPRHLSQHVGGLVIARSPLHEIVPIENASMKDRTVIEWDKDDIDIVGMFKVDCLGLGMLTVISKALVLINNDGETKPLLSPGYTPRSSLALHTIPWEDPAVYEMASDADTIGVFQIESRAQIAMLPRMQPREFYDFVVEVAIVRPGPIQGQMVHPYLQNREKRRKDPNFKVPFPKPELGKVLEKTLGVPLFQEQAMRMAIVAAGFTGVEADQLRRAMAAWKRSDGLGRFHDKFVNGMLDRGYETAFAENCFKQISGFGEYGFPESHAASFAKLVYASAWIKRYHPAVFLVALLNSQPMGFYAPAQLVRDALEHGVEVRAVDVNTSAWDCTLENRSEKAGEPPRHGDTEEMQNGVRGESASENVLSHSPSSSPLSSPCLRASVVHPAEIPKHLWGKSGPAVRLGFRQIKGMRDTDAAAIVAARQSGGAFTSLEDLQHRAGLDVSAIKRLARADAFGSLQLTRRQSAWEALTLTNDPMPLVSLSSSKEKPLEERTLFDNLPPMPEMQEVLTDYATHGLSLKKHPVSFARSALSESGVVPASWLLDPAKCPAGRWAKVAGLVLVRQRPGTASGVVFVTLEDETGVANLVIWSRVYEMFRPAARHATLLQAEGVVQREGKVVHLVAQRLFNRDELLQGVMQRSRDFH